jgi:hypothetical protein
MVAASETDTMHRNEVPALTTRHLIGSRHGQTVIWNYDELADRGLFEWTRRTRLRVYLMTGDFDEPFSIGYALLGPATNPYLIRRQEILLHRTMAYFVRFYYFDKRMSDFGEVL